MSARTMSKALDAYLAGHAWPEHGVASQIPAIYDAVIVIPMRCESPETVEALREACRDARVLAILVVNAREDDAECVHVANARCLRTLAERGSGLELRPGIRWVGSKTPDLLLIDRASRGRRFDRRQGVGLARRMGSDVAASMWAQGKLRTPWIHGTDADAVLGREHFAIDDDPGEVVALVHPYWHVPSGDRCLDEAVALYEIALRWYVALLATAGSCWAYATLGSCISVRVDAYAAVRGVPRRQAAEDFYLLAKVAKLGGVLRPARAPIRLMSRASDRVPFGTGPAVARLMELRAAGGQPSLYHPATCESLVTIHRYLRAYAESPEQAPCFALDGTMHEITQGIEFERGLRAAIGSARDGRQRLCRIREWFDAFRTLKVVHALRDRRLGTMNWCEALETFVPTRSLSAAARRGALDEVRHGLAALEPSRTGIQ